MLSLPEPTLQNHGFPDGFPDGFPLGSYCCWAAKPHKNSVARQQDAHEK